jgi:peptidoglycan/LPS O-acetylase OafA/YrhL
MVMSENEPAGFRDRLLEAQPMTAALRDEYRKELDDLLNHRLTPRTRFLAVGGLLVSLGFAAACVVSFVVHHAKPGAMKFILPAYAAIFLVTAGWIAGVIRRGGFARRASFAVVERLGGIMVGLYVSVILLTSLRSPSAPESTYSMVWAVMFMMVGFAWGTGNRIAASTLETREHLLRLESKLADVAERVTPQR